MFRLSLKHLLIIALVSIDFLLVVNIVSAKSSDSSAYVLGAKVVKKKVKPTPTIKVRKFINTKPIMSSTPTPAKTATKPTSVPVQNPTGDLLSQVNSFRASKGLSPLVANSDTCFFANMRVQEIQSSFNHDGFRNRIDSKTLPYSSYSEVAENIAMNSNPNDVVPAWINSAGHNANMSKDVPYGCVVGSGNFYVFEAWRP